MTHRIIQTIYDVAILHELTPDLYFFFTNLLQPIIKPDRVIC